MALSQTTLVQRVRRVLGENPTQQLGTVANGSSTTITVTDSALFSVGAILEWQDNGEQVKVKSITNATTVEVFDRGYNGTTGIAHSAVAIFIDPVFTIVNIKNALDRCIQALWPKAWKKVSDTVTPGVAVWYDLAADAIDLIHVVQRYGTSNERLAFYGSKGSGLPVEFHRNLPTALVASGVGLRFPNGFSHSTNAISVDYRAKLTTGLSGSDYTDVDDGLLAEALVYGAASKLVGVREVGLVSFQDVSQGDTPLGPQQRLTTAAWLEEMYRKNVNDYYDELVRTIPPMRIWSN